MPLDTQSTDGRSDCCMHHACYGNMFHVKQARKMHALYYRWFGLPQGGLEWVCVSCMVGRVV